MEYEGLASAMEMRFYPIGEIPCTVASKGLVFMRRRFSECWRITREDITVELIMARENLVLLDHAKVVGWLGIENTLELSNACIENGLPGSFLMEGMLRMALERRPKAAYFVQVPTEPLTSALICLRAGFDLTPERPPQFYIRAYPEGIIRLIRLDRTREQSVNYRSVATSYRRLQEIVSAEPHL